MTAHPIVDSSPTGTLLAGERQVLELIATGAPLGETLDALCRVIDGQSGLKSSVYLLDHEGERLSLAAGPDLPEAWRAATRSVAVTPTAGACGAAITSHKQVIVPDVLASPLYQAWLDAARASDIASLWSTPSFSPDGRLLDAPGPHELEAIARTKSGERLDLLLWMGRVQVLGEECNLAIACDMTDRKRTARELARSERLLRLVLDTLPVGVAVVDRDGDITISNPASQRIWGGLIRSGVQRYVRSKAWWHNTGR